MAEPVTSQIQRQSTGGFLKFSGFRNRKAPRRRRILRGASPMSWSEGKRRVQDVQQFRASLRRAEQRKDVGAQLGSRAERWRVRGRAKIKAKARIDDEVRAEIPLLGARNSLHAPPRTRRASQLCRLSINGAFSPSTRYVGHLSRLCAHASRSKGPGAVVHSRDILSLELAPHRTSRPVGYERVGQRAAAMVAFWRRRHRGRCFLGANEPVN